jgi:hypothetical protein
MLFVYALAAVVSLAVAWMIKLIFGGVKMQKVRADARRDAKASSALRDTAADRTD